MDVGELGHALRIVVRVLTGGERAHPRTRETSGLVASTREHIARAVAQLDRILVVGANGYDDESRSRAGVATCLRWNCGSGCAPAVCAEIVAAARRR